MKLQGIILGTIVTIGMCLVAAGGRLVDDSLRSQDPVVTSYIPPARNYAEQLQRGLVKPQPKQAGLSDQDIAYITLEATKVLIRHRADVEQGKMTEEEFESFWGFPY